MSFSIEIGRWNLSVGLVERGSNGCTPPWHGYCYGSWLPRMSWNGGLPWRGEVLDVGFRWIIFHASVVRWRGELLAKQPGNEETPSDTDLSFVRSTDAAVWAAAFVRHCRKNPGIATDEGAMIGWFANAMMAEHDHGMPVCGDELDARKNELMSIDMGKLNPLLDAQQELASIDLAFGNLQVLEDCKTRAEKITLLIRCGRAAFTAGIVDGKGNIRNRP